MDHEIVFTIKVRAGEYVAQDDMPGYLAGVAAAVKDSLSAVGVCLYPELVFTTGYELVSEAGDPEPGHAGSDPHERYDDDHLTGEVRTDDEGYEVNADGDRYVDTDVSGIFPDIRCEPPF